MSNGFYCVTVLLFTVICGLPLLGRAAILYSDATESTATAVPCLVLLILQVAMSYVT